MDANLIQYLPDWFRQIKDYQYLMQTETGQFEILAALIDAVHQNFYVSTADEGTISDWENLLHIIPNTQIETQDFRRARIINRLSYNPPFTLPYLYDRLDLLIGKGKWAVTVDYGNYTLYVEAAAENQAWAGEVLATINTIKPCHIVYTSRPLLSTALCISETVSLPSPHADMGRRNLAGWICTDQRYGGYERILPCHGLCRSCCRK
ncbi:putative phage tail protein [uncultured Oscillibacter sp.]|uniref:putative phage tail protein n=1 Tax=uncultured Oscillibacter sp. TaxID=876091 RepID=UPI0025E2064E|nr:putative phage tail protein [uncultured Oscillibacter sp.]